MMIKHQRKKKSHPLNVQRYLNMPYNLLLDDKKEFEKIVMTEPIFKHQTADPTAFYKLQTVWIISLPHS